MFCQRITRTHLPKPLIYALALCVLFAAGCSNPNVGPDIPTTGPSASGDPTPDAENLPTASSPDATTAPKPDGRALKEVIDAARAALADAARAADPFATPESARAFIQSALSNPATDAPQANAILMAWTTPSADSPDDQALLIQLIMRANDFPKAQAAAWAAAEQFETHRPALIKLWYQAFAADPAFIPPTLLTLEENTHITKLAVMSREGTSILFKAKKDDETVGVLKPQQDLWLSNYRGEIAAFRLCPLIHCGFSVPHNQEARIAKDVFTRVNAEDKDWMENRANKGIVLTWFKDDAGKSWLYGTYKAWAPGFTQFPIEDSELWDDILKIDGPSITDLEAMPFETFLKRFEKKHNKKYKALLERTASITMMNFSRQLSNLHVYDALTNNWDRYSSQPYPGLNCQFNHGQFVSIDNGATFQNKKDKETWADRYTTAGRRMRQRVERYSRSTINALRWMDPQAIRPILFPPSAYHPDEDERFEMFLERREAILEHVDKLIKKHGEEKVLVFP